MRPPVVLELSGGEISLRSGATRSVVQVRDLVAPRVKPVLKWAGGKQWLSPAAPHLLPKEFSGNYFEPFLGGGAMFFAIEPGRATLSDTNDALIGAYQALSNDTNGVVRLLRRYPHNEQFYYRIRSRLPRTARSAAAKLIYLNRTCWNGLYRVNRQGQFNTPFGKFKNPTICDRDRLHQAARLLRRARLFVADFERAVEDAREGDFVYFDPPYITGHQGNGFLKYNACLFSWDDQTRLARCAIDLASSGVYVLVSNAEHKAVVGLYRGFQHYSVTRRSLIGGSQSSRGQVDEALLSSYPIVDCESEVV
jgi:DNA adenine methylase